MSVNLNKVFLAGNLTRDPEMRSTPAGTVIANLRLAVNRQYTTRDGEKKDETAFITVVVWGRQADICNQYLKKGSPILVEGRLQFRTWETQEKEKRSVLEVTAERVQFLARREEREEGGVGEEDIEYPNE